MPWCNFFQYLVSSRVGDNLRIPPGWPLPGSSALRYAPSENYLELLSDAPSKNCLEILLDAPSENCLDIRSDAPSENYLELLSDAPSKNCLEILLDAPSENCLEILSEAPRENCLEILLEPDLICALVDSCSYFLQDQARVLVGHQLLARNGEFIRLSMIPECDIILWHH